MNLQAYNVQEHRAEDGSSSCVAFFCASALKGIKTAVKVLGVYLGAFRGQI